MNILLVDDSKTMRTIQKKMLTNIPNAQFSEASDGVEGLSVIAAAPTPFDLLIVDWNMPNMDGLTFVKKVRETDKKSLIIMATTEAEKSRVLDAVRAGVNNYVVKPFTGESLFEKVSQTIAKAKAA